MAYIVATVSKYIIIFLMCFYTLSCFTGFFKDDEKKEKRIHLYQNFLMFFLHFLSFLVMYLRTDDQRFVPFYLAQVVLFLGTIILYNLLYPKVSRLIVNNMCMCICIGLMIIARLNFDLAIRQLVFAVLGVTFGLFVPVIIRKMKYLAKWRWIYAVVGIVTLLVVFFFADEQLGARRAIFINDVSVQPSEVIKIVFVFFVAASLKYSTSFKDVVITTAVAGVHIVILVLSTDLGTSVTMFIAYIVMLYVATRQPLYALLGIAGGAGASILGYQMFSHVRTRVAAWQDPFVIYDTGGYQLAQSLFAVGSGGWFGTGLFRGLPNSIPVVTEDFIFSAIVEELGVIFALCLILICVSCYVMFLNVAMELRQPFYKLIALGLGTTYIFQVFLTVGGSIQFIPSTGVTLPLISYGGSSFLSTMVMFGIIQGLYIVREDEEDLIEKRKQGPYEEVERTESRKKRREPTFQEVPKQRIR